MDRTASRGRLQAPWRLRTRLTLALVLVFVPVFALVLMTHLEALKERRNSRVDSLASIDLTLAASLDGYARGLTTFADAAAITIRTAAAAGFPLSQETFGTYFVDLAKGFNVRSIFIVDETGKVIAGTTGNVGFDVSSRPYFLALRNGASTTWSGGLAGQLTGQTTLAYGRVVHDMQGRPLTYLIIAFYPPQLTDRLPPDLPGDATVTLTDNTGVVLLDSRSTDPETPTIDISSSSVFRRASSGEAVLIRGDSTPFDEDARYGAFAPIPTTGWVVGITRPASAIDGPLNSQFRRNLGLLGAAFALAIAAMFFIAHRLSAPLRALATSASVIAQGQTPSFPASAGDRDVEALQEAMRLMSDEIRVRESALAEKTVSAERMANQLARLHASRNALAALLPPAEICAIVVSEAVDAIGAKAGLVLLPDDTRNKFDIAAQEGYPQNALEQISGMLLATPSPFATAYETAQPLLFEGAAEQVAAFPNQAGLKAAAGTQAAAFLPLRLQTQVLGVLCLGFDSRRSFTTADIDLMLAFANQAAQSLNRATLYETVRHSNAAKDEFLGIVAHELRTPITSIFGGARLLNDRRRVLPPESREELLRDIEEQADRMARLIENLLLLARAEMGRVPERVRVDLRNLLTRVSDELARLFPGRQLLFDNQSGIESVWTDETSLSQVIFNLLSNASKYSPQGEPIDIVVEGSNEALTFHVMDRGPGVKPEELGLIFESFYRSAGTAHRAEGKGIGLAVCRRLVESLGGEIGAVPRPGGGLDVWFTIPEEREAGNQCASSELGSSHQL